MKLPRTTISRNVASSITSWSWLSNQWWYIICRNTCYLLLSIFFIIVLPVFPFYTFIINLYPANRTFLFCFIGICPNPVSRLRLVFWATLHMEWIRPEWLSGLGNHSICYFFANRSFFFFHKDISSDILHTGKLADGVPNSSYHIFALDPLCLLSICFLLFIVVRHTW